MYSVGPLLGGKRKSKTESLTCKTSEFTSLNHHLGIEASPVRADLLEWVAKIKGLEDTLWEGNVTEICRGVLSLSIFFYERHRKLQPHVVFNTVPFHPNVNKDTGEVCISFPHTGNGWDPRTSTFSVLRIIQHILSNPLLEEPENLEAAEMFLNRPNVYREVVEQCVKDSQAVEREDISVTRADPKQLLQTDRFVWRISFEEYLHAWIKMATSKAGPLITNESLNKLISPSQMLLNHCGSLTHELVPFGKVCLMTIKDLMYGPLHKHQRKMRQKNDKLTQIDQIRQLCQFYRMMAPQDSQQGCPAVPPTTAQCPDRHEHWETEVDKLVAWTHTLSLEKLEEDQ